MDATASQAHSRGNRSRTAPSVSAAQTQRWECASKLTQAIQPVASGAHRPAKPLRSWQQLSQEHAGRHHPAAHRCTGSGSYALLPPGRQVRADTRCRPPFRLPIFPSRFPTGWSAEQNDKLSHRSTYSLQEEDAAAQITARGRILSRAYPQVSMRIAMHIVQRSTDSNKAWRQGGQGFGCAARPRTTRSSRAQPDRTGRIPTRMAN